jgi:integrase/recombinase XerD
MVRLLIGRSLEKKNPVRGYRNCFDIIATGIIQPEGARMAKLISFSQALEGFMLDAHSRHLSPHTILDYSNTFRKFLAFLGQDPPIAEITPAQVKDFLAAQQVSKKTVLNYHIGLSALWSWAVEEGVAGSHILRRVERVKPEKRSIVPYSIEEIKSMLGSIAVSKSYTRPGKKETCHALPTPERNRAIILLLLDTGIRASELCELRLTDVDLKNNRITVMGKGSKERTLPISPRTSQSIWRYLKTKADERAGGFLFVTQFGEPMDRDRLLKSLTIIGRRGGVREVNVHRFRHTFAINYLRNGGDPYTLQMMMGHSTMEMVKTYLALAQADLEKVHRMASPVDNWRL